MPKLLPALTLALLVPLLTAGKRRESAPLVSFHLEAGEGDSPRETTRVLIGTDTFRVQIKPSFTQGDIAGFYPFLADDGKTFGTAFKLNGRATRNLQALTTASMGRKFFTVAGTDPVSFVVINEPIDDGFIVCWKGLNPKHIDAFKAAGFKRIEPQGADPVAATPEPAAPSEEKRGLGSLFKR